MLFNSFAFLLVFLPASLLIQAAVERFMPRARLLSLLLLSIVFYGYWDWRFIPLLLASIVFNWIAARLFVATGWVAAIAASILANLLVLGLFKYLSLLIQASNLLGLFSIQPLSLALPLGISFFTFHHIMYLSDLRAGRAPLFDPIRYGLYISFFPQVLAGPLVRWREVMHQFERPCFAPGFERRFGPGLILLAIGLVKKVYLGDALAQVAAPAFEAVADHKLTVVQAWDGLLAFTFQIYFDFSGYTDMALGIALMFGIVLPQNFAVPYRATSIAEFWRRWHMTLSRFLRDYLYVPFGGNRNGPVVQILALTATMTLGGLWHGAGLTFIAWGMVQGIALAVHLLWRKAGGTMPSWVGIVLTFLFVALTWVLFRAPDFATAAHYYAALVGAAPHGYRLHIGLLLAAASVAMLGPTAWDVATGARPRPTLAFVVGAALVAALLKIGDTGSYEFIYFKF